MTTLTTPTSAFAARLQAVAGIVMRNSAIPILEHVLLTKQGDKAWISAQDLEMELTALLPPLTAAEDFATTVNARLLQQLYAAAPGAEVTLHLAENRLRAESGSMRVTLNTLEADGYPRFPREKDCVALRLPQQRLRGMLARLHHAIAVNEPTRYYLNGLLLKAAGGRLALVASDGYRLGYTECALAEGPERSVIVPRKTILHLGKLLQETDDEVRIELGRRTVSFLTGEYRLTSKVIDGQFPDFNRVLPGDYTRTVTLGRRPLLEVVKRAAILATDLNAIRLHIEGTRLTVHAHNPRQEEAADSLAIAPFPDSFQINLNFRFLQDVLAALDTEQVSLAFADGSRPLLLTVPGEDDFRYVIMPLRL